MPNFDKFADVAPAMADVILPQIPPSRLPGLLPSSAGVKVIRVPRAEENMRPSIESWSLEFVIDRLSKDGAFDASSVINDPDFGIVTRVADGSLLFIETTQGRAGA